MRTAPNQIPYSPSQYYWRKAAAETTDPVILRGYIETLVGALEYANRSILGMGYWPPRTYWAPGEKPTNNHAELLAREGYRTADGIIEHPTSNLLTNAE